MTIKQRIVAASAAIAFIVGLSACGSPDIEARKDDDKIIFTNKSEKPVSITAVKFPKQDCKEFEFARILQDRSGAPKLSDPLKYGQSRAFYYVCKGATTLLHVEIETDQGDVEFNWE